MVLAKMTYDVTPFVKLDNGVYAPGVRITLNGNLVCEHHYELWFVSELLAGYMAEKCARAEANSIEARMASVLEPHGMRKVTKRRV